MKRLLAIFGNILLLTIIFLPFGVSYAEEKKISKAELDQMMAPIALYPDALLSQILMATTYPADITEAVQWSKDNPKQEGDAAVKAVQDKPWDASVMSLVAFPQVLSMMGTQPDWVKSVGDAFLASPEDVMDTVQKLRKKAKDEGNLETTEQQKVIVEEKATETIIVIEPADPQVVYVPVYNTTVVYGTWWWPHYTPWYYYPPGYAVMRGVGFAVGVGITHALWGNCSWGHGHGNVNINVNRYNSINVNNKINSNNRNTTWNHNSNNRGNKAPRNKANFQKTGNRSGTTQRQNYRGRDAQRDQARTALDKRAVSPSVGRKQLQGDAGRKARESVNQANRNFSQHKSSRNTGITKQTNRASHSPRQSQNNAFQGVGNAQQTKRNINRGNSSHRSMTRQRSSGGTRSGGARRGGGRR
ncbi:DUF3300 domain-containing protein [methanotrophic endosymbiont of Bathymodiolus puteoserpentis (Logatchev)]|jgi:hypothetical protein|uniref:DUF3300 domain-containing protein n=1 Tax=methanotrophic endosymbiont of Bathymodiolus puteoserpentis (Logatchev) TaxID=343235 RepID=UPI0013C6D08B|nr:DUF3300 domain-containing protein [methanotrophic endosymbiont of Bathymodiolus puteoserpentis (Logatchev)]SHE23504.1 FIG01200701: possible membrane protein [methanotrophic endosymbiont of Bathymodiolus puteoserpentis (Logatchev)]